MRSLRLDRENDTANPEYQFRGLMIGNSLSTTKVISSAHITSNALISLTAQKTNTEQADKKCAKFYPAISSWWPYADGINNIIALLNNHI